MGNEELKKELLELKKKQIEENEKNRLKKEIDKLKKPTKMQVVGKLSLNMLKGMGKIANKFMKNQEKKYKSNTKKTKTKK
jgi:hypothetical protein